MSRRGMDAGGEALRARAFNTCDALAILELGRQTFYVYRDLLNMDSWKVRSQASGSLRQWLQES